MTHSQALPHGDGQSGYELVGDIILGIIGGLLGGFLAGALFGFRTR